MRARFGSRGEGRRRNPARRKPPPSHDLWGEREHKLSLFGAKEYAPLPKAKRKAGEATATERAGQLALDLGATPSMFNPGQRRRRNIEQGYVCKPGQHAKHPAGGVFHPIRRSKDYDPDRLQRD